jgi:E3 ubiquitin-protein ligase mind-bomb
MLLGVRVVRGPDWNLGNQDGGEGCVGTIVSLQTGENGRPLPPKSVLVCWDTGLAVVCRVGLGDCYDLRVFDSSSAGNSFAILIIIVIIIQIP